MNFLEKALENWNATRWCKFRRKTCEGSYCALGRLDLVMGGGADFSNEVKILSKLIQKKYGDKYNKIFYPPYDNDPYVAGWIVANWNNAPERIFNDIETMFKEASILINQSDD